MSDELKSNPLPRKRYKVQQSVRETEELVAADPLAAEVLANCCAAVRSRCPASRRKGALRTRIVAVHRHSLDNHHRRRAAYCHRLAVPCRGGAGVPYWAGRRASAALVPDWPWWGRSLLLLLLRYPRWPHSRVAGASAKILQHITHSHYLLNVRVYTGICILIYMKLQSIFSAHLLWAGQQPVTWTWNWCCRWVRGRGGGGERRHHRPLSHRRHCSTPRCSRVVHRHSAIVHHRRPAIIARIKYRSLPTK